MITLDQKLQMLGGGVPPIIKVTQYDTSVKIVFQLYIGGEAVSKSTGDKAYIEMTKPDNKAIENEVTFNEDGTVEIQLTEQMTAVQGDTYCKIFIKDSTGRVSSTAFILQVEAAGIQDGAIMSESDLPEVRAILDTAEQINRVADSIPTLQSNATTAIEDAKTTSLSEIATAKTDAVNSAEEQAAIAKSWAVGPSGSDESGSDLNNAKYWAGIAQGASQNDAALDPNSTNPVQNKVLKAEIEKYLKDITVSGNVLTLTNGSGSASTITLPLDSALSDTSTNPVQNNVVNSAISGLNTRIVNAGKRITALESPDEIKLGTQTLAVGNTSLSWTNSNISDSSMIEVYTSVYGISPESIKQNGTTVTVTFEAQDTAVDVCIIVKNAAGELVTEVNEYNVPTVFYVYQSGSWGTSNVSFTTNTFSVVVGRTSSTGAYIVQSSVCLYITSINNASSSIVDYCSVSDLCNTMVTKLGGSSWTIPTTEIVPLYENHVMADGGYGGCAAISTTGKIELGRIYTTGGAYGSWPEGNLATGGCSFNFYFLVNP